MWDFYMANARYLCPIGGNAEFNVLVFPARASRPQSFRCHVHGRLAGRAEWVADVRPAQELGRIRREPPEGVESDGAKIGIDGLAGPLDPDGWLPHSVHTRLRS